MDDGSTDDTRTRALHSGSPVVIRQCAGGPGAARNTGLALTSGEYVALLDADDRWPPGRLARLVRELEADPSLDAVFGAAVEFGGGGGSRARPGLLPVRLPTTGVVRREVFGRIDGFRVDTIGGDTVDWMTRFLGADPTVKIIDDVVLERRVHANNTGRGVVPQRNRLAALKRELDRRRAAGS